VARFLRAANSPRPRVVSIQNAYNLVNRTFEIGLAEFTERERVGLLAYSPLAQGYLTGKYHGGARPPGARTTLFERAQRYEKPEVEHAVAAYLTLAQDIGVDPAQLAIAFVTSRPFVTSNIIGARRRRLKPTRVDGTQDTPEIERR
jgi:aryl-alcohol dehydrogenase-like predicted oxidoreductase